MPSILPHALVDLKGGQLKYVKKPFETLWGEFSKLHTLNNLSALWCFTANIQPAKDLLADSLKYWREDYASFICSLLWPETPL